MVCILKPECNFLYGYFRCLLWIETVDIEVKEKMMRGIHTFRRDWTIQVISCNPWSTWLCPYPSLIRKMKTSLELEGKLGPQLQSQPCTSTFLHDENSLPWKTLVPKKAESKMRAKAPAKRRFNTKATTQMQVAKLAAMGTTSIPVTWYNLAQGKFERIPYPTRKLQEKVFPLPAVTIPRKDSNLKLQLPPQPHRRGKIPHGLIPCQLPQTCSMLEHLGQLPLLKHPQLLKWKRQRRRFHPG